MNLSNEHMDTYKEYLKHIHNVNKLVKSVANMKRHSIKKELFANEEEIFELEGKKELEEENKSKKVKNKIYKFSNGDLYIGEVEGRNMHGKGCYEFFHVKGEENYTTYSGEFKEGKKCGCGEFKFENGNVYTGSFDEDTMNGIGQIIYNSSDVYIGNWDNGKKNDFGIYIWSDNYVYAGDFKDGKMDGQGICYNDLGEIIYNGEWKNNLIDGLGVYNWGNGKRYEGEFFQGKKHGKGIFYLNDELVYDGTWKFDKPSIFDKSLDEIFSLRL
ncbi:hypothetical protein KQI18_01305 [Clostridioides mangenotii]|uniref:MORN repeat-containing protein n=1 Tax=Metaclostridioides mangenotii TaxID=1540 RepID=UPI001C11FD88|nr:hypothetical protein [Clostridioides mangenotii]MBU5306411.1 hypothetical protein [Clostridioides mangenotii]